MKKLAGVMLRQSKFYVHPYDRADSGVYLVVGPVQVLAATVSSLALGEAVHDALRLGKDGVPHPTDWSARPDVMQKAVGVRSAAAVARGARVCEVFRSDSEVEITPMKPHGSRGAFEFDPGRKVVLPAETAAEELGQTVRRILEECEQ
jgi:hypothetical protein